MCAHDLPSISVVKRCWVSECLYCIIWWTCRLVIATDLGWSYVRVTSTSIIVRTKEVTDRLRMKAQMEVSLEGAQKYALLLATT